MEMKPSLPLPFDRPDENKENQICDTKGHELVHQKDEIGTLEAKELQDLQQILDDEELSLQILQDEMDLADLEAQMELLKTLEAEESDLQAILELENTEGKGKVEPKSRPPATPCTSLTMPRVPLPPAVCN